MAKLMGWTDATKPVPFTMCVNETYTHGVEDEVLGSLESARLGGKLPDGGMDFWWIDWQQGGNHGGCVFEGLPGNQIPGQRSAGPNHIDNPCTSTAGDGRTCLIAPGEHGRAERCQPQGFGYHTHGVGGELPPTCPGTWTGFAFQLGEFCLGHFSAGHCTHRFKHILNGDISTLENAGCNGATVQHQAR